MFQSLLFMAATVVSPLTSPEAKVEKTLNAFHQAASDANFEGYFSLFSKDGVFIGTDATERWDVESFKKYVAPHFAKGKGWTYTSKSRHINFSTDQKVAWFDEVLDSKSYGTARGTGVLILEKAEWKISQYHLTFPIPNDLAGKFTDEIKAFEAKAKLPPKANR